MTNRSMVSILCCRRTHPSTSRSRELCASAPLYGQQYYLFYIFTRLLRCNHGAIHEQHTFQWLSLCYIFFSDYVILIHSPRIWREFLSWHLPVTIDLTLPSRTDLTLCSCVMLSVFYYIEQATEGHICVVNTNNLCFGRYLSVATRDRITFL